MTSRPKSFLAAGEIEVPFTETKKIKNDFGEKKLRVWLLIFTH